MKNYKLKNFGVKVNTDKDFLDTPLAEEWNLRQIIHGTPKLTPIELAKLLGYKTKKGFLNALNKMI